MKLSHIKHIAKEFVAVESQIQEFVEWGSTNTSWHLNVHHVKTLHTHEV